MQSILLLLTALFGIMGGAWFYRYRRSSSKENCMKFLLENSNRNKALLKLNRNYNFNLDIEDPIVLYGDDSDYMANEQKYSFRHCLKRHVESTPDRFRELLSAISENREEYDRYLQDLEGLPSYVKKEEIWKAGLTPKILRKLEEELIDQNMIHPVTILHISVEMPGDDKHESQIKEYLAEDLLDCLEELE